MSDEQGAPATAEPKAPRRGVGTVIREQLRAGATNEEAQAAAVAEFPSTKTTVATVSWYRNDMRKKGEAILSAREVNKARAPAEAPADQADADAAADAALGG